MMRYMLSDFPRGIVHDIRLSSVNFRIALPQMNAAYRRMSWTISCRASKRIWRKPFSPGPEHLALKFLLDTLNPDFALQYHVTPWNFLGSITRAQVPSHLYQILYCWFHTSKTKMYGNQCLYISYFSIFDQSGSRPGTGLHIQGEKWVNLYIQELRRFSKNSFQVFPPSSWGRINMFHSRASRLLTSKAFRGSSLSNHANTLYSSSMIKVNWSFIARY